MGDRQPAEVFPPGEILREELEARGWSQTDLADILGRPFRVVNEIIAGKRGISPETAHGLAEALGTSAELWLNLDSAYQLSKVSAPSDAVSRRAKLYAVAPIRDMIRRGWIEESTNIEVLENRLLDFLGKEQLDDRLSWAHSARKSTSYDEEVTPAQAAWLARARQLAPAVMVDKYSPDGLNDLADNLKSLLPSPEEARRIPRFLADAGIRFVIVEPFPGTKIDGASFWLDERSPVIAMSLRYDRIDNFWFVLEHERFHTRTRESLGTGLTLDIDLEHAKNKPRKERAADRFAVETLINQEELDKFIRRNHPLFSTLKIQGFAAVIGVHPGIVVGQLHNREIVRWTHFRKMLTPIRQIITQTALTDGWGHFPEGI